LQREFLKSKIHGAYITGAELEYMGSFTIDEEIMEQAGILEYERIHIYNVNSGSRIETYAIKGERGKKDFCLNGAAARQGAKGDKIIIVTYASLSEQEVTTHTPKILIMDKNNNISKIK